LSGIRQNSQGDFHENDTYHYRIGNGTLASPNVVADIDDSMPSHMGEFDEQRMQMHNDQM